MGGQFCVFTARDPQEMDQVWRATMPITLSNIIRQPLCWEALPFLVALCNQPAGTTWPGQLLGWMGPLDVYLAGPPPSSPKQTVMKKVVAWTVCNEERSVLSSSSIFDFISSVYIYISILCVLDGQPGFCFLISLLFVWFIIYSILVLCTCLETIHKLDHISFCSCKKPTIVCRITSSYKLIWMILSMFSRSAVFPQSALAKYLPQMYTGQQVEQACLIVK